MDGTDGRIDSSHNSERFTIPATWKDLNWIKIFSAPRLVLIHKELLNQITNPLLLQI